MGIRDWFRRAQRTPEPVREAVVVDRCAAWTEWSQWELAATLAERGLGPYPCRHWHVATYEQFGYTHQQYWTRHWWDRHRMSPPHPATTRGTS